MRRIICFCLALLLLLLSVGCGREEETAKLPVLDEETRISIEAAWRRYPYESDYIIFPHWYTELTRSGLDGVRYYGRYGCFDVWYAPRTVGTPMTRDICGIPFSSSNEFVIYARSYTDTGLEPLYEHGMLSLEDLEEIAAVHQAYEERIVGIKAAWDTEATEHMDEVELPVVSNGLKQELEQAYKGVFGFMPNWDRDRNGGYYGTYNGCSVFIHETMLTAESCIRVADVSFWNSGSFVLVAYKDGQWKTMEDAYDFYWLTKADVKQIQKIHNTYELQIYGFDWSEKE